MDYCEMADEVRKQEAAKWLIHHVNDATPYRSSQTPLGHRPRASLPTRGDLVLLALGWLLLIGWVVAITI